LALSRRELLALAGAGLTARLRAGQSDFWNTKPAAEWSEDETLRLLSDSPWARPAVIEFAGDAGSSSDMAGPAGGLGGLAQPAPGPGRTRGTGPGTGAIGVPQGGARPGAPVPPERRIGPDTLIATVVWESAQPVLDALHAPAAERFAQHYVIAVSGALLVRVRPPAGETTGQSAWDVLKPSAMLQALDKPPVHPDIVERDAATGRTFRFDFARTAIPLGTGDSEVWFQTRIVGLRIQARFDPAAMLYRGKLAL
jgi:hypothetical protein